MNRTNLVNTISHGLEHYKAEAFVESPLGKKLLKKERIDFREHIWTISGPEKSKEYCETFEFYLESKVPGAVSLILEPKLLEGIPKVNNVGNLMATVNIVALGSQKTADLFADIIEYAELHL